MVNNSIEVPDKTGRVELDLVPTNISTALSTIDDKSGELLKALSEPNDLSIKLSYIDFFSQAKESLMSLGLSEDMADYWTNRSCGFMCLLMGLKYFGVDTEEVLLNINDYSKREYKFFDFNSGEEKTIPFFSEKIGWSHYGLLQLAREYGLYGTFKKLPFDREIFFQYIKTFLEHGCVISCSVNYNFTGDTGLKNLKSTHLVVVTGFDLEENKVYINDPKNNVPVEVDMDTFFENVNLSAFVLSDKKDEEFLVKKPFIVESFYGDDCILELIVVHENEYTALEVADKNKKSDINVHILKQNQERFIRFEVGDQYVRVNPNRIFSDKGREETLRMLNKHLDEENIEIAKDKAKKASEYILSKLDTSFPLIALHNNAILDINEVESNLTKSDNIIRSDNERFSDRDYIVVSNKDDFEKLKEKNINVVYINGYNDDGSLFYYCSQNGVRYFTIETGYDNSEIQQELLDTIEAIL